MFTDVSTLALSTPDMASPLFPNESTSSINTRISTSNPVSGSLMSSIPGVVNVSDNINSSMESTTVASTLKEYNTNAPISSAAYTIIESPNTLPDVFSSSLSTDHEKMTTVSELSTSENVIRTSPEISQNTPTVSSAPFTSTSGNFASLDVSSRVSTSGLSSFVTASSTVSLYGTTSNEVTGLHFTESANNFSVSPTTTVAPQLSSLTRNFETGTSNFITNIGDTTNVTFTAENETKPPVSDTTITEANMFSFHSSAVTSNVNPSSETLTVPTYVSSKSANTDMDVISTEIIWSNSTESQVPSTQSNVQPSREVSSSTENTNMTYDSLTSTEIHSVTPESTRFTGEYPNGSSVSSTPLPSRTTDVRPLNNTTASSSLVTSARYENSTEMSQSHTNSTLPLTPFLNFTSIVTMNESTTFSGFVSTETAGINNQSDYSMSTESVNYSSSTTSQQSTTLLTSSSDLHITNTTPTEQYGNFTSFLPLNSTSSVSINSSITFSSFYTTQISSTDNQTDNSVSTFTPSESINVSSSSTPQQSTTFITSPSEKNGTNTTSIEQSEFTTSLPSSDITSPYTMSSSSFFTNQTAVTSNQTDYYTSTFTSSESINISSSSIPQQSTTFMTSSSEKNGTNTTSMEQSEFTTSLPSSSYTMSSSSFFINQTTVTNNETNYSSSTFTSSESINFSSSSTPQQSTTFMTSSSEKNGTNTTSIEQSEFTTSLPSGSYTMSSSSFFTNQTTVTNNETNYSTSTFTSSESVNFSSPSTTQQSTFMTSSSEKNGTNTTSTEQSELTTSLPSSSYTMSSSSFFTNQTTVTNNETNYSTSTFTSSESVNFSSPSTTQQSTTFMTSSSEKNGTNTTSVEQSEFTTSLKLSDITSPYTMSSTSFFTNQTAATSNQTDNTTSTFTPSESLNFTSSSTQLPTFMTSSSEVNGTNSTSQTKTSHYFSTASYGNLTTNSSESTFMSTEVARSSVTQSFTSIANNQSATSEISNTLHSFSSTVPPFSASTQISSFNTHSTEHAFTTSSHTLSTTLTSTNLPTANSTHSLITEEKTTSAPSSTFTSKLSEGTSANNRTVAPTIMSSLTTKSTVTPTPFISTRTTLEVSTSHTLSTSTRRPTTTLTSTKHPTIVSTTNVDHNTVTASSMEVATSTESSKTSSSPSITKTAALTSMITVPPQTTRGTATPLQNITESVISTTAMLQVECNITERLWVKTVLSLNIRRSRASDVMNLNLTKGLTQALQKAFNDSHMLAQIESLQGVNNVTVGYYVRNDTTVYIASVVVDVLNNYGIDKMMSDIKQYVADVQSLPIPVAPWISTPALWAQLKTVLRFVGPTDNIQSCSFTQTMEERLQNAFEEAEATILNAHNILSVQILSTSQSIGSPAVSLIYVVWNQTKLLNGTISSSLLNQLTAELVGYYLLFPPLIIAEPLEYQNLDTSSATTDYWVITVIQDVSNASLEENYQSFASLMEQRLAELFVNAQNQARRFRRATTVGSYTVQMVSIKRIAGPKNPAELTYYVLQNGTPLLGTTAAKILSTVDSQTMALTLGYFVQLQAEPVVKNPPNNLWIIAAVLAPIAVVTVIIIIITAVLCRKNKNDFKPDTMSNMHSRAKPVQGFDYAKQHLGQQGGEEDTIPVTQETVILPLPVRDMPLSQDRGILKDGSISKIAMSTDLRKRLPSEDDSVMSNESGKPISNRSSPQKVLMQQKMSKEDSKKRNGLTTNNRIVPKLDGEEGAILFERVSRSSYDAFDTSSGSLQLISIRPLAAPPSYSHPASERSQDSAIVNGEVNKALKQKSDIEHYRNKLRLKAKRKGYYDFPAVDSGKKSITQKQKQAYEKAQAELDKVLNPEEDLSSTYVKSKTRQSQMKNPSYRSRQSLNSPSPGGTEMDLLVTREKPRRGIRNSGYDTEPELIEETNVDHIGGDPRGYTRSQQVKGHSETSTLSSQPSIDEVRQQMHMLLEEAFSLASAGQSTNTRTQGPYNPVQQLPYSEVVTSAPGTINRSRGAVQWVPAYGSDTYQYSLPRPAFRFSQLPEMAMGSSPPTVPPPAPARPTIITSLRRSTSDNGTKNRPTDHPGPEQQNPHDAASFVPIVRPPGPAVSVDQPISNYSGNPAPAVYAIPAARPGFTGYFIPTPPMYRGSAWMPYSTESDASSQWAEAVPLPGYVEAYPHSRYQQNTPPRIPRQYSQTAALHPSLDQVPTPSTAASQQSLTENDTSEASLTNISTAALVKAIREEVAKLAKKQTDMFEFQV
ncbi:UPF0606 protein KIAA1549L-like isoform X2 [Erpetoichthys calabaricus]|uniref:UPF0606 protein KIAA1549L-like isoform X2 n=1 Tax=Erpetoichthys calabaricus TaxID=27687 RepID=UPI002234BEA0|nr:UPF0606 protein KIAA1549L-like isoform X2 [Erpetoichthys calabaricus]